MPDMKGKATEKKKINKKMSKAQVQLAILKKKQCDIKALLIVERLLEPNVEREWLLHNLRQINKSHMEDVIEERAIIKLCGYVLCENPLTVTITQQYHISTRKNKVYDVTRRKNFCSSRCYGASSYLLEQMLTSPLWLRDNEEIPTFRLFEDRNEAERIVPGEEVLVKDFNITVDKDAEKLKNIFVQADKEVVESNVEKSIGHIPDTQNKEIMKEDKKETENTSATIKSKIMHDSVRTSLEHNISSKTLENTAVDEVDVLQEMLNSELCINKGNSHTLSTEELNETTAKDGKSDNISDHDKNADIESARQSHEVYHKKDKMRADLKSQKHTKSKHNNNKEQCTKFYTLVVHIEQCVNEWITEDTLTLFSGEVNARNRLLEHVSQHDKYLQVCKKLNQMQLEEEKDNCDASNTTLKPLPHFSVLQEEGKKIELKVRAFYQGNVVIEQPDSSMQVVDDANEPTSVLPLIDAHAPKALRRRIFLEKLHKILPDLLLALSSKKESCSSIHYNYSECNVLVKVLVNTFALSATNIIFKSAEWTLVGLIIIKMLSILDPQLKNLLSTKQASMYISLILMSYKLDSNYLNRFIIEVTNNTEIFNPTSKTFA